MVDLADLGASTGQCSGWQGDDLEQRLLRNRQLLGQFVDHINRESKPDFGNQFCSTAGHQAKPGENLCQVKAALPAYTKNEESRMAYMLEPEHQEALRRYLDWRTEKRLRVSNNDSFGGLQPDSPLFLSRG